MYVTMSCSILLEEEYEQQRIPVRAVQNQSSHFVDQAKYIDEIHYIIGNRVYIENI
jgi:hypothetical protein